MAKDVFREIFNHQIESTESAGRLTLRLFEDRKILIIEQNGKCISIDRWQVLELATELLNIRKYLKTHREKSNAKASR